MYGKEHSGPATAFGAATGRAAAWPGCCCGDWSGPEQVEQEVALRQALLPGGQRVIVIDR
jgi:hypothetical protein